MRACDNPFRVERTESLRYRSPGFAWSDLLERLEARGGRGALRGAQGRGKTTLLLELGERLARRGFEVRRLRPDPQDRRLARRQVRRLPRGAGPQTALLLDGADRLGPLEWRLFARRARSAAILVVTTHGEGLLPTLHRCETSAELLHELTGELTASPERIGVPLGEIFSRENGNIRTALRTLYDQYAAR